MRELTLRIRFTALCLGNQKLPDGRFVFQRDQVTDCVVFFPTWHKANVKWAANLLNHHQDEVDKIHWDPLVDGTLRQEKWHRRYYRNKSNSRQRYIMHEAFFPGQEVGINACLPARITDDDFIQIMSKVGQFRGISPWSPGNYGFFEVASIREILTPHPPDDGGRLYTEKLQQKNRVQS